MVFDTWGGVLTPAQYGEFSLRYMAKVVAGLTRERGGRRVPNIVFTKGGGAWLERIAAIGCDAVGVDWTTDLKTARARRGRTGWRCRATSIRRPCSRRRRRCGPRRCACSRAYGAGPGHVFNLGHGITPDVDPAHVSVVVETVQGWAVPPS